MKVKNLLAKLEKEGLRVVSIDGGDFESDPEIILENNFCIQVYQDKGYGLSQEVNGKFNYQEFRTLKSVLIELKKGQS